MTDDLGAMRAATDEFTLPVAVQRTLEAGVDMAVTRRKASAPSDVPSARRLCVRARSYARGCTFRARTRATRAAKLRKNRPREPAFSSLMAVQEENGPSGSLLLL